MKIKPFTLVLAVLFQCLSLPVFAQQSAVLSSLLDKNSEFILPQTPDKISKVLHTKTIFYEDANGEKYAKWPTESGLELYSGLGKNNVINEMFFEITEDKEIVISGLPYGLVMNKTVLEKAEVQFRKNGAKVQKLGADSEYAGGSKLIFRKGKHFTTLLFNDKNLLKSIRITTELVDPSVN